MSVRLASVGALTLALAIAACGSGGTQTAAPSAPPASAAPTQAASDAPATEAPATEAPVTEAPATAAPGASLHPSQSDAGVVGSITIPADTRGERTGTHTIVGVADDGFGSDCAYSFEGDEFTAVAYYDAAGENELRQLAVVVPTDSMPANDGEQRIDITTGVAYADFYSESGFGTAYTGDASSDDGSSSIDVTVTGDLVTFDFEATTWDDIAFTGQVVCQGAQL